MGELRGVRVNAIAPGFFMTPLNEKKMSDARKALAIARTPMGRFGKLDRTGGRRGIPRLAGGGLHDGRDDCCRRWIPRERAL